MDNPLQNATDKWLASMEARKRDRSRSRSTMPPWDENAYFQVVKETTFGNPVGPNHQIAAADPQRVALIFSVQGSGAVRISTKGTVGALQGVRLMQGLNPWTVTQADYGNLCSAEWFADWDATTVITVIEISLREFPS